MVFPKDLQVLLRGRVSKLHSTVLNPSRDLTVQAGRHTDQSVAVFSENLFVDARFVIKPFKLSSGSQFAKIAISLLIFSQQD